LSAVSPACRILLLLPDEIGTVLKPHSKSGLKKFFAIVPDMTVCVEKGERKGTANALRVLVEICKERLRGPKLSA